MATMKAIITSGDNEAVVTTDRPLPKLRPRYVRVKVRAVAINPTDWKHVDRANLPVDFLVGCDFAGTVDEVGTGYSKDWKVGDRICGFAHGGNEFQKEDGAFAENIVAVAEGQMRIPTSLSFEDAATLGVATITCGQGLFSPWGLDMKWPDNPTTNNEAVLIYGGSSAMGTFGIQLARLAGYRVLTTCSPKNFDLVKSLGASEAFDYRDPDCASKISKAANGDLKLVWDTISEEDSSMPICQEAISSGGIYANLLGAELERDDIESRFTLGYTVTGEPIKKTFINNFQKDDTTEDFDFVVKWSALVERLLAEGKLKTHSARVSDRGLDGVIDGMDQLRNGTVSAQKLVYTL